MNTSRCRASNWINAHNLRWDACGVLWLYIRILSDSASRLHLRSPTTSPAAAHRSVDTFLAIRRQLPPATRPQCAICRGRGHPIHSHFQPTNIYSSLG
eukprot:543166-Pleurochrysis_carterae.AAC.1